MHAAGRVESSSRVMGRGADGFSMEGVTGLKTLGVRDLTYKLAFLANHVESYTAHVRIAAITHHTLSFMRDQFIPASFNARKASMRDTHKSNAMNVMDA